ncbi:Polynucleotidyl transferase, ribonuclease H superfamily protein [Trifolium repens]|nr:Polynucleotidyl transferase, ribonuclease H superfamily protein [Trifolium repens]
MVFQNKNVPVMDFINQAQEEIAAYQHHLKHNAGHGNRAIRTRSHDNESWTPPPIAALKLNVDAHLLGDGRWALGWILRREDGSWVRAATKIVQGVDEPVEAEARGIREALIYLASLQTATVIVESDNQMVVKAIQNRRFNRKYWGHLAREIRETLDESPNLSICWANRNKNVVAHSLAKWAEVEPNKTWINNPPPPPHIVTLISKDMENLPPNI